MLPRASMVNWLSRSVCALLTVFVASCVASCAATRSQVAAAPPPQRIEMEPLKIEVSRDASGQQHIEAFDAATLFEEAGADLNQRRFKDAVAKYDRLVRDFPDSRYVAPSLYNAGLGLESSLDYGAAATRYRTLAERFPTTRDALDALFRLGACYAEVGNWAASGETFARVLETRDLALGDQIEARARRGLAQYNLKDPSAAERTFREALAFYRQNEAIERLESDFFLALCQYYLGEITHDEFRAVPVRLPEKQMKVDLEAKARLLLAAQARYVDTARIRNPAWATAAGYQMALLYKELYDALLEAPIPPQLDSDGRQVYLEELKKTIEPLLRKAIHAHELTQQVAERTGIDNDYVRKSTAQLDQLRTLLDPGGALRPALPAPAPGEAPSPPTRPARPENDKRPPPPVSPTPPSRDGYHPRVVL